MTIYSTSSFQKKYQKLAAKQRRLSQVVDDKIELFTVNPQHPSLRLHKLSGQLEQWSISVKQDLRLIFQYVDDGILLVDLGSHDEVY